MRNVVQDCTHVLCEMCVLLVAMIGARWSTTQGGTELVAPVRVARAQAF